MGLTAIIDLLYKWLHAVVMSEQCMLCAVIGQNSRKANVVSKNGKIMNIELIMLTTAKCTVAKIKFLFHVG